MHVKDMTKAVNVFEESYYQCFVLHVTALIL